MVSEDFLGISVCIGFGIIRSFRHPLGILDREEIPFIKVDTAPLSSAGTSLGQIYIL